MRSLDALRTNFTAALRVAFVLLLSATACLLVLLYRDGLLPASVPDDAPAFEPAHYAHVLRYVDPHGTVDYAALAKDRAELDTFVASLAGTSPKNHPERFKEPAQAVAYWLNAYNALTLQALVDSYPVAVVGGPEGSFWRSYRAWPVGGERLTLSAIEKRLARVGDPRVYFALHTGARGGPWLFDTPYDPDLIDGQLTESSQRFMGRPEVVRIQAPEVFLSPLLRWHSEDFLAALPPQRKGSLLHFVWAFLPDPTDRLPKGETRADLDRACGLRLDRCNVRFTGFDWALDDRRSP